jgi:RNA-directed DNA polymerase
MTPTRILAALGACLSRGAWKSGMPGSEAAPMQQCIGATRRFNVRRCHGKLLIKPSTTAIGRVRRRLSDEMRRLRGANAAAVLAAITPIVRGWAAYYRGAVSSRVFSALDDHLWRLTYKWACASHANKPKRWIVDRYFGQFNPARRDRWVFGDRTNGTWLPKFAWTKIVRHQLVPGRASPDDPALARYWANRRRSQPPPLGRGTLRLLRAQHGRCPLCGDYLLHADREPASPREWERWLTGIRTAITKHNLTADGPDDAPDEIRLMHHSCRRRNAARITDLAAVSPS